MDERVLLCADPDTLCAPETMGLDGEVVVSQPWLICCDSAEACRRIVDGRSDIREVWVVSCDDVAPINLAAVVKRDHPDIRVRLVALQQTGSFASRSRQAHIDELMDERALVGHYRRWKTAARGHLPMGGSAPVVDDSLGGVSGRTLETVPEVAEVDAVSEAVAVVPVGPVPTVDAASNANATPMHDVAASRDLTPMTNAVPIVGVEPATRSAPATGVEPNASLAPAAGSEMMTGAKLASVQRDEMLIVGDDGIRADGGQVLAVMGATGGCGKSTLAAVVAAVARQRGFRTVVVDADLQFGDMHRLMGIEHPLRLDEAARSPHRITAAVQSENGRRAGDMLPVLAPPAAIEAGERYTAAVGRVIGVLRESFDLVVVNTASHWNEVQADVLDQADAVLFLMAQRPTSLHATVRAVDLCARMGVATGPFVYAINGMRKNGLLSAMDASCALHGAHVFEIPDGGMEVEELVGAGYLAEFMETGNPMIATAVQLAAALVPSLGTTTVEQPGPKRRLTRVRRRSKRRVPDGAV